MVRKWAIYTLLINGVYQLGWNHPLILHPGRITWNIIMEVWKIIFLSKCVICRFHVNLPGCNPWSYLPTGHPSVGPKKVGNEGTPQGVFSMSALPPRMPQSPPDSATISTVPGWYIGVSKNRGKTRKMDGENNGNPYIKMDDLGGKPTIFGNIHIVIYLVGVFSPVWSPTVWRHQNHIRSGHWRCQGFKTRIPYIRQQLVDRTGFSIPSWRIIPGIISS